MAHRRISSTANEFPHAVPDTMKAAAVDRFGPPSVLTLHEAHRRLDREHALGRMVLRVRRDRQ